jgi:hypothetical protein
MYFSVRPIYSLISEQVYGSVRRQIVGIKDFEEESVI